MRYLLAILAILFCQPAYALLLPSLTPEVKLPTITIDVVAKASKPEVILYTTSSCPACDSLKNKLSCVPAIEFVCRDPPAWVTSVPVLHWQADNGRWWSMGNNGAGVDLQTFVEQYNETCPSKTEVALDAIEAKEIGYPLRGNYWSVGSNWSPSRGQVIYHLQHGVHAGKFSRSYLGQLDWRELQSLHSDDHESRVKWASVEKSVTTPRSTRTVEKVYTQNYTAPKNRFFYRRSRSRGGCPGGNCPL